MHKRDYLETRFPFGSVLVYLCDKYKFTYNSQKTRYIDPTWSCDIRDQMETILLQIIRGRKILLDIKVI